MGRGQCNGVTPSSSCDSCGCGVDDVSVSLTILTYLVSAKEVAQEMNFE